MDAFFDLMADTFSVCKKYRVPILVAATIFSVVMVAAGISTAKDIEQAVRQGVLSIGIDNEVFEDILERMEHGDEAAFVEFLQQMDTATERMDEMTPEDREALLAEHNKRIHDQMQPTRGMIFGLSLLVILLSSAYYVVIAVHPTQDFLTVSQDFLRQVLPLSILGLCIMFVSLVWIPLIGWIWSAIALPRFSFAAPLYVQNAQMGIVEAVKESYRRTAGKWREIVAFEVGMVVAMWIVMIIVQYVSRFFGPADIVVVTIFGQLQVAFAVIFVVLLGQKMGVLSKIAQ